MKTYSHSFLIECLRHARACDLPYYPMSDIGLSQFHDYESRGIKPSSPDPYFTRLLNGKAWHEWTLNFIASTYLTDEWLGWAILEYYYRHDLAGLKQIEQRCRRIIC